jgi:hypothetical protein
MGLIGEVRQLMRPRQFFAPPPSPYVKANPEFRAELEKVDSIPLLQKLRLFLEKRYSLRVASVGNAILVLTVTLAATVTYFDSVTDRLVTVEAWARPLFLPALWAVMISILFLIQSVKAPKDEITPNPAYTGDEIQHAVGAIVQEGALAPYIEESGREPSESSTAQERALLIEVASRTNHDRVALRTGRYFRNKSLRWLGYSVVTFVLALSIYAIVSPVASVLF